MMMSGSFVVIVLVNRFRAQDLDFAPDSDYSLDVDL